MDLNKKKLAVPNLLQLGSEYIGGPLVNGIEAVQRQGAQVADYVKGIINQRTEQQNTIAQAQPTLNQSQVDSINATPGINLKYKKALWDVMNNQ